jgi:hypothetical protein
MRVSKENRIIKLRLQIAEKRERLAIFLENKEKEEQLVRNSLLAAEQQLIDLQEEKPIV